MSQDEGATGAGASGSHDPGGGVPADGAAGGATAAEVGGGAAGSGAGGGPGAGSVGGAPPGRGGGETSKAVKVAAPVGAALLFVAAIAVAALASDSMDPDVASPAGRASTTTEVADPDDDPAADGAGDDDETAATVAAEATTTTAAPVETTTTAPPTTAPPTTAAPSTTAAPAPAPPAPGTGAPAAPGVAPAQVGGTSVSPTDGGTPVRFAVIRQGVVYLKGSIPTREAADEIIRKAEAVVGPGNVVDSYLIDPNAPLVESAPLYVEDRILFTTNSSEIAPDFVPLLQLGISLLTQNPNVTLTIIGHTDAVGSPEYNMALSERRVASVIRWFTDRGIDPARLIGEARGLTDPLVPAEPGRSEALNRRVEFIITGLLDG